MLSRELGIPIVCPDAIRVAMHGHKYISECEPYVWSIAMTMVRSLFMAGHDSVILDATNTTWERRKVWLGNGWEVDAAVSMLREEDCIKLAERCGDHVIVPIIQKMARQYEPIHVDPIGEYGVEGFRTVSFFVLDDGVV